ncbi:MAG: ogt [Bacillales bacterium]|jgi:methylated-DNA-[protein]-cysteine S-methyltransferase|nr:ogt [Bacillales bacterium]
MNKKIMQSPLGPMEFISDGEKLIEVLFLNEKKDPNRNKDIPEQDDTVLLEATRQMKEYFAGNRKEFQLPLSDDRGTNFQKAVWNVLNTIPYGEVLTYKQIAEYAGSPKGCRAAGGACRANNFTIIVPCHRVLGTNGSYTGYSGEKIHLKEWLLKFESEHK